MRSTHTKNMKKMHINAENLDREFAFIKGNRPTVRFDFQPFGSDIPSQPIKGAYVKEPSFAPALSPCAIAMHKSLWHNFLSDSKTCVRFLLPLICRIKKDGFRRPLPCKDE